MINGTKIRPLHSVTPSYRNHQLCSYYIARSKENTTKVSIDISQPSRGKVLRLVPSDSAVDELMREVSERAISDSCATLAGESGDCSD
jgi:hypothetical protein